MDFGWRCIGIHTLTLLPLKITVFSFQHKEDLFDRNDNSMQVFFTVQKVDRFKSHLIFKISLYDISYLFCS